MKHNYSFRRILSVLVLLMAATLTWAYDFEVDGIYYNILGEESVKVTKGDEYYDEEEDNWCIFDYTGEIVVPSNVTHEGKTYNVTSLGRAFEGCSLSSIVIGNNVTSIDRWEFRDCPNLTSIVIGSSVTSIDLTGLLNSSFDTIIISEDNPVYDSREGCNAIIKSATNTLILGGNNTIIPSSVTSIENGAFHGCSLTSIVIPESVTSIGYNAFSGCSSLTSVVIGDGVTRIEDYAFEDCSALTSIDIPNSVTWIGDNAFSGCSALTSANLSEGLTYIRMKTFYGCSSLTSITIPEGVIEILPMAFFACRSLTRIDIPSSVTWIGSDVITACPVLATVICRAENVPEGFAGKIINTPIDEATLYVPASALEEYKAADGWKDFGTILPIEGNEDVIDGIDSPAAMLYKATNTPYYTLDGKPAANPTRKGIYVKDGRKVMIR